MSYDFAVWVASTVISSEDAGRHYLAMMEVDEPTESPDPRLIALKDALLGRWPALEDLEDPESNDSPWAMTPRTQGDILPLTLTYPGARQHANELIRIALGHDAVVYDPQRRIVLRPSHLETFPHLQAENQRGDIYNGFSDDLLTALVSELNARNSYLVVSRTAQHYMQTQVDRNGEYTVEYRSGGPDHHFRVEGLSQAKTLDLFREYSSDDAGWDSRVDWKRLSFGPGS